MSTAVKRALREQSRCIRSTFKRRRQLRFGRRYFRAATSRRSRKRDLLTITTQLAIMTKSGVDLASAFESLSHAKQQRALRKMLVKVHKDVTGGKCVSDAMRAQAACSATPTWRALPPAKRPAACPKCSARLAQFQRTEIRKRATIRTLLAYPMSAVDDLVVGRDRPW